MPTVKVEVLRARELDKDDDSSVKMRTDGEWFQTRVIKNQKNPEWNETFIVPVGDPRTAPLLLTLWEHDELSSDLNGVCAVALTALKQNTPTTFILGVVPRKEKVDLEEKISSAEEKLKQLKLAKEEEKKKEKEEKDKKDKDKKDKDKKTKDVLSAVKDKAKEKALEKANEERKKAEKEAEKALEKALEKAKKAEKKIKKPAKLPTLFLRLTALDFDGYTYGGRGSGGGIGSSAVTVGVADELHGAVEELQSINEQLKAELEQFKAENNRYKELNQQLESTAKRFETQVCFFVVHIITHSSDIHISYLLGG